MPSSARLESVDWVSSEDTSSMLLERVDERRIALFDELTPEERAEKGQYGTPASVARLMASMFTFDGSEARLLDAGAGVGTLTAAFVEAALASERCPASISVVAYEIEPTLIETLRSTLAACQTACASHGVPFGSLIIETDFVTDACRPADLFSHASPVRDYNYAIQNPPYRKINARSTHRRQLDSMGLDAPNLYAAFVGLATRQLVHGGQLVSITPRSFCNGKYFGGFRSDFLSRMGMERLHSFARRDEVFGGDSILQENIIVAARRGSAPSHVLVSESQGEADGGDMLLRRVPYDVVVPPGHAAPFIYLVIDGQAELISRKMGELPDSLSSLGLSVSTGRVVDFRVRGYLQQVPEPDSYPLIYPVHMRHGGIEWPKNGKKPNALKQQEGVERLLVPAGDYVLTKRFSSKEQRRRVDAFVYSSDVVAPRRPVGFENHVNYFHERGRGLPRHLARGLALYLNSSVLDQYFRLFSGHTQVNATDLRAIPYPTRLALEMLGRSVESIDLPQDVVDASVERSLFGIEQGSEGVMSIQSRIDETRAILTAFGFPARQTNERSALTLLALLGLGPDDPWSAASAPMLGITQMMAAFARRYGKEYAPNTRETVRRQTVKQFVRGGLVTRNPDDPSRPVNSGRTCYQVVPEALTVIKTYGTSEWDAAVAAYVSERRTLAERYSQARRLERIEVTVKDGEAISLSPGSHNELTKAIVDHFLPRFGNSATLLYVGDTENKWAYIDEDAIASLGIEFDSHGKFPDVVGYSADKNWLYLLEAVTSHGPVSPGRRDELKRLFRSSTAGLVYVTAFLDRATFVKYCREIAWESEVWIAENPGHMIHFDGSRFLGPYEE